MEQILHEGLAQWKLPVPDGAVEKLCRYAQLLLEQNKVMNLTAITEPDQVARLHFLDSAALLAWGSSEGPGWLKDKTVIDVGTGAGFPGMVLKILEPSIRLTLLDSLGKRVNWLQSVCDDLGLTDVTCIHARAEEQALVPGWRDSFDVATSRAVASLPQLTELCLPYVKKGGSFVALKSIGSGDEMDQAAHAIKLLGGRLEDVVDYPVPGADVTHRLVPIRKLAPTLKGYPRKWAKIKKDPL